MPRARTRYKKYTNQGGCCGVIMLIPVLVLLLFIVFLLESCDYHSHQQYKKTVLATIVSKYTEQDKITHYSGGESEISVKRYMLLDNNDILTCPLYEYMKFKEGDKITYDSVYIK